jgi:hypothetical protein
MIEDKDIDRLKEIFVTRRECDNITGNLRETLNEDKVALAEIKTQLAVIKWVLTAVGGGIITMIIKMFVGG